MQPFAVGPTYDLGVAYRFGPERYALLVSQLAQEEGRPKRGWQTRVAERLGIHRSYVSRITAGDVSVIGSDVVQRAIERLDLDASFFMAPNAGSYRQFVRAVHPSHIQSAAVMTQEVAEKQALRATGSAFLDLLGEAQVLAATASTSGQVGVGKVRQLAKKLLAHPAVRFAQDLSEAKGQGRELEHIAAAWLGQAAQLEQEIASVLTRERIHAMKDAREIFASPPPSTDPIKK